MFKECRILAGLTHAEAVEQIGVGERSLYKYEKGYTIPPPDVVLQMSIAYNAPSMTTKYCREYCAIGRAYGYDYLNAVDTSLQAVHTKLEMELLEALEAVRKNKSLLLNKTSREDFTDQEWNELMINCLEFLDVEHNVEILKIQLEGLTEENTLVAGLTQQHNQKCWDRGYIRKEKRPLCAAR